MKRFLYTLLFISLIWGSQYGQAQNKRYTVVFYNVENVFDTLKTEGVLDEEFTPDGINRWNGQKYWKKMANLEKVFYEISTTAKDYPTIIGVSEIENRSVLEDMVSQEKLLRANYQIVHYDSPDARGVDVALFYRPDHFKYEGSAPIPVRVEAEPDFKTRDILMVWGEIEGERFYFFVCHWPSRTGGQQASEYKRIRAAQCARDAADSVMRQFPDAKIVIMGDLNDDPVNKSLYEVLGAKGKTTEVENTGFFNPYHEMFKKGHGTLAYNDAWNLFDNIVVNGNLLHGRGNGLKLVKGSGAKYYGNIFDRSFLRQQSGQYKNYPLRTYVSNAFQDGYSDHFPVYIYISK